MATAAFISGPLFHVSSMSHRRRIRNSSMICACVPQPPRDPGSLRSESSRRRNQPPKPLRRRRRRRRNDTDDTLDWAKMDSIPLVRPENSPETGEDYWVDLDIADKENKAIKERERARKTIRGRGVNENMKERLRKETFAPYEQNWAAIAVVVVAVLAAVFSITGGLDSIPVIQVPDL